MVACTGWVGPTSTGRPSAPALTRHSRVLALDLVGHGLTPAGRRTPTRGAPRLLSGFLQAVGGTPAILMGNSMGGLVAALQAVDGPRHRWPDWS